MVSNDKAAEISKAGKQDALEAGDLVGSKCHSFYCTDSLVKGIKKSFIYQNFLMDSNLTNEQSRKVKKMKCAKFYKICYAAAAVACEYHMKYLMKQGNRFLYSHGLNWVRQTLNTPGEGYNMFRMESHAILKLEELLVSKGWLHPSKEMTSLEALVMFLWSCAHSETNRNIQNKFGKSGETVSRKFGEVLDSLCLLAKEIVRPPDFRFAEVPSKIKDDRRYWPYFEGCIGAIDGTHIPAIVPTKDQICYIGRKGYPTQNVMLVCNFDMLFTFVVVGWPGTAHDTRILSSTLEEMKNVFPHPPEGDTELLKHLLSRGINPDLESDAGMPLVWAAGHGQQDAVSVLLEHNANGGDFVNQNVVRVASLVLFSSFL